MDNFIYTLRLSDECWYVGLTSDLERRVSQHFLLRGSEWTKLHPPLEVVAVNPGGEELEQATTIALMCRYSWRKVRGGKYTSPGLSSQPRAIGAALARGIPPGVPRPSLVDEFHMIDGDCLRVTQIFGGEFLGLLCGSKCEVQEFRGRSIEEVRKGALEFLGIRSRYVLEGGFFVRRRGQRAVGKSDGVGGMLQVCDLRTFDCLDSRLPRADAHGAAVG